MEPFVITLKVPYSGSSLTPRWVGLRDEPDYGGAFMFRGEPWFMVDSREGGNPPGEGWDGADAGVGMDRQGCLSYQWETAVSTHCHSERR